MGFFLKKELFLSIAIKGIRLQYSASFFNFGL